MGHADLGEADYLGDALQRDLVLRVAVAVHQANRHCAKAVLECGLQIDTRLGLIQRQYDVAMGANALGNLNHRFMQ